MFDDCDYVALCMWGGKCVLVNTGACRLQQWVPDPLEQPDVGAGSGTRVPARQHLL